MQRLLAGLLFVTAAPIAAQDLAQPATEGGEVETTCQDEGGLTGSTTDESEWADLGVAIPAFATDRDAATPANANGTAALGREVARVITANLRNNGLFKPVGQIGRAHV